MLFSDQARDRITHCTGRGVSGITLFKEDMLLQIGEAARFG